MNRNKYYFTIRFQDDVFSSGLIQATPPTPNSEAISGWNPLITVLKDTGEENNLSPEILNFYRICAKFYDYGADIFKDSSPHERFSDIQQMLGTGTLTTMDGLSIWNFEGLWPHSINFGDLCYSSDTTIEIEVTWRFQKCTHTEVTNLVP